MKRIAFVQKSLVGILGIALCLLLAASTAFAVEDDGTSSIGVLTDSTIDISNLSLAQIRTALGVALVQANLDGTVTVTGTKSFDEESKILLTIPSGVTVLWQANLEAIPGDVFEPGQGVNKCVVGVEGSGTFKLESPGAIVAKDGAGNALMFGYTNNSASGSTLIIDNGTVRAADGRAVLLYSGSVTAEIGGEATVLESRGSDNSRAGALVVFAAANVITITDGTFTAASGYTINMDSAQGGKDSLLTILGGTIVQTGTSVAYAALRSSMDSPIIHIAGSTTILAENAKAIEMAGSVGDASLTIGGDAVVTAGNSQSSSFYPAIYVYGREDLSIIIKDNAKVQSFSRDAGVSPQGTISASVGQSATTGTRLTVQDNAQVYADNSNAVYLYDSYVEVKGNALIHAKDQYAVYLENVDNNAKQDEGIVDLSGGALFAYGTNASYRGDVVYCDTLNAGGSNLGVVIAWDNTQGTTNYTAGTAADLAFYPTNAEVMWALDAQNQSGIAYRQGENSGFIPLADVTVTLSQLPIDDAVAAYAGTQSPQTGDSTPLALVTVLLIGAAAVLLHATKRLRIQSPARK